MADLDRQALDRALWRFPILLAAAARYGSNSPMFRQCLQARYEDVCQEYRHQRTDPPPWRNAST